MVVEFIGTEFNFSIMDGRWDGKGTRQKWEEISDVCVCVFVCGVCAFACVVRVCSACVCVCVCVLTFWTFIQLVVQRGSCTWDTSRRLVLYLCKIW